MAGSNARSAVALALGFAACQAVIALAAAATPACFGSSGPAKMYDDLRIYDEYATLVLSGRVPYREFAVEYPPSALPFFVLPRLCAADERAYRLAFAVEMLLVNAIALVALAVWTERTVGLERVAGRLAWYTSFFAALCPLVVTRFDIAPMAIAFAAASAWCSGQPRLGGVLAAVGMFTKIAPGVIALPASTWEIRRSRSLQGPLAFGLACVLGAGIWFLIGGAGIAHSVGYHMERGIEIGSLPAGLLMLWGKATGAGLTTRHLHSSTELVTAGSKVAARLALPVQVFALTIVAVASWRTRGGDVMRLAAAGLVAFIAFGKVLSPQYVIWLLPFIAVLDDRVGRFARPLFLACCLATTLIYPWTIHRLVVFDTLTILLLNTRNALLVGLFVMLVIASMQPEPSLSAAR